MLLPLLGSESVISILVFILRFCSASQPFCSAESFGVPNYRDCLSAWHLIPFAMEPSDNDDARRYELWSEPQFLLPAFSAVFNRYKPLPINQLPKIWSYSTSIGLFLPCLELRSPLLVIAVATY